MFIVRACIQLWKKHWNSKQLLFRSMVSGGIWKQLRTVTDPLLCNKFFRQSYGIAIVFKNFVVNDNAFTAESQK